MKIGVNRWTMPADWSLEQCFEAAAEAGFDGIELNLAEDGPITPDSTEAQIRDQVVRPAERNNIALTSLSTGLGWKYPITANEENVRRKGIEILASALRIARWMEVDAILCVPGVVTPDVSYDVAYDRALAGLKELCQIAAEQRVFIGVENVWNKFLLSPLEMARFIDEVGSPWVGAYFDAGNVLVYGYPQHWIRVLGSRIKRVHVKDFRTGIGNITGFCNPLQGDLPWHDVRAALDAAGYDGFVTAEVDGYRVEARLGLKHIAEALRAVFG